MEGFESTYSQSMASPMVHGVSELSIMDKRLVSRNTAATSVTTPIANQAISAALCLLDICRPRTVKIGWIMSNRSVTPPAIAWSMYHGGRAMQLSPVYSLKFQAAAMGRHANKTANHTEPKQATQRKAVKRILYWYQRTGESR